MATIQVRNISDDALRAWKVRAASAGQSLQEYMRSYLNEQAARPTVAELFDEIERRPDGGGRIGLDKAVRLVREDRDSH